jgi:hypothetical protein
LLNKKEKAKWQKCLEAREERMKEGQPIFDFAKIDATLLKEPKK